MPFLPGMIKEEDLHVMLKRVADQDSVLQQIANFLLDHLEVLPCEVRESQDVTSSISKI